MDTSTIREERRVVTALFADIVGSTALAESLEPEDAKIVVGEAIARVIHAVEDFGGTVKDLAGDGVLALFGAPVAHEDDPERAIRAALRITEEIRRYGAEVERGWAIQGFDIRVGIATGPVAVGAVGAGSKVEYGATGDALNTAARLQSVAEPGTVLIGDATHRLVAGIVESEPPRSLELKGKSGPVVAHRVVAVAGARERPRGLAGVQAPFTGRDAEFEVARSALTSVLAGSGSILFLIGEPGIGKSRLLAELRGALERDPTGGREPVWIEGRCVSYGGSMPYWPFRDLLRRWLGVAWDDPELRVRVALRRATERLFDERAPEVYPYLGALIGLDLEAEARSRLNELSPEALQYRTFEVVRALFVRLAEDRPVVVALEDLHWADATSLQLLERMLDDTEDAALLLILTHRPERDHPSWGLREQADRRLPHRTHEVALHALSGAGERALLHALVGGAAVPEAMEARLLASAEGNPFFLEELVRSLIDTGALVRDEDAWRFDHEVPVEVPPTVEKVILARIDRLSSGERDVLAAASALGRQFGLPLLEAIAEDSDVRASVAELQRLDLVREERRWPEPEFRFKHALIQETAYRTIATRERQRLHARAAAWIEQRSEGRDEDVAALLAHHWLAADDEAKAVTYLTRAGDRARQEYALDEAIRLYRELLPIHERRGEKREIALVLFKLALALHMSLRFGEANETYDRAFGFWVPPEPSSEAPTRDLRVATSFVPNDLDPRSAIAWPNIQLCMQLFDRLVEAWPERTIVPGLAERWEISDDGLRYVFHLREGLRWSDGTPLTAADVEFGIKRVLDPDAPGSSVAIYFVLENGQDYYLRRNADADGIGVRALDDRTIEFRLVAPAPYFMSVMNRPDGGPQPRHAIERYGDAWVSSEHQVVSGPFRIAERTENGLVLRRREDYGQPRPGNVREVRLIRSAIADAIEPYDRGDLNMILVRYTPRLADLMPDRPHPDAKLGPAAWSAYLRFDHHHPVTGSLALRRALAHAIDRDALADVCPANLVVARGGVVPPALQGHTPDIALRYDPDLARRLLAEAGFEGELEVAGMEVWAPILRVLADGWRDVFGRRVSVRPWSWRVEEAMQVGGRPDSAHLRITGWFPGYADPEYFLRLLFHSDSRTNEGGFSHPPFDELIERARRERSDRERLELYHAADRMAVVDRVACVPLVYGRNVAYLSPSVHGWWEFGKSCSSFADLVVD